MKERTRWFRTATDTKELVRREVAKASFLEEVSFQLGSGRQKVSLSLNLYRHPLLSVVSLSVVSLTCGWLRYKNIKWRILEVNISFKLPTILTCVMNSCAGLFRPTQDMSYSFVLRIHTRCIRHPPVSHLAVSFIRWTCSACVQVNLVLLNNGPKPFI